MQSTYNPQSRPMKYILCVAIKKSSITTNIIPINSIKIMKNEKHKIFRQLLQTK